MGNHRWASYAMTAPRVSHQAVCGEMYVEFHSHFQKRPCRVFLSPIDVKFSEHDVVQPDLIVVCDRSRITASHIDGPPTLVVEILSPSTQRHDRVRKLRLYARFGVIRAERNNGLLTRTRDENLAEYEKLCQVWYGQHKEAETVEPTHLKALLRIRHAMASVRRPTPQ